MSRLRLELRLKLGITRYLILAITRLSILHQVYTGRLYPLVSDKE